MEEIMSNSFVETKTTPKEYFRVTSANNPQFVDLTDINRRKVTKPLSDLLPVTDPEKLNELEQIFKQY